MSTLRSTESAMLRAPAPAAATAASPPTDVTAASTICSPCSGSPARSSTAGRRRSCPSRGAGALKMPFCLPKGRSACRAARAARSCSTAATVQARNSTSSSEPGCSSCRLSTCAWPTNMTPDDVGRNSPNSFAGLHVRRPDIRVSMRIQYILRNATESEIDSLAGYQAAGLGTSSSCFPR